MAYPATPKSWVAGDVLTAAQLNAELRNALLGAFPLGPPDTAWTSYTPTLTQSATVTKTVVYAKYTRVGRLITATFDLSITGAGTAANAVLVGLPVTAAIANSIPVGIAVLFDTSASSDYPAIARLSSTTVLNLSSSSTNGIQLLGSQVFTAALASGDRVNGTVTYEAAT